MNDILVTTLEEVAFVPLHPDTIGLQTTEDLLLTLLQDAVDCLGNRVDTEGIKDLPALIEAIEKAPLPQKLQQSFLGTTELLQ